MANSAQNDNAKCEVENQYKIEKCHSTVTPITDWQNEVKHFTNAKAVVWYYDAIEFLTINGKWEGRGEEEIVRLRIFDEKKELHLWRSNDKIIVRLREDNDEGKGCEYVEAEQILNWNDTLVDLGFKKTNEDKAKVKLITRNYIDCTASDIGQAGYVDCRFVRFENVNSLIF